MSKKTSKIIFIAVLLLLSCSKDKSPLISSDLITIKDIDGNTYKTIKIGDQLWMAENLKVTRYRNGDVIPNATDSSEWSNFTSGAYCSYHNNDNNVATYGLLYNWYVVNDNRHIAPKGWHIPTDAEWKELEIYLGMSKSDADKRLLRGIDEGGKLKETGFTHWANPNTGATNESGFSALPSGYRGIYGGFGDIREFAIFWSSTESTSGSALSRWLAYNHSRIYRDGLHNRQGFSIRCVMDN